MNEAIPRKIFILQINGVLFYNLIYTFTEFTMYEICSVRYSFSDLLSSF